jgi:nucleotide-binding universal stress UspA family protein
MFRFAPASRTPFATGKRKEISMLKTLLAVDGSDSALRATRKLIESVALYKEPLEVELVTVHLPVPPVGGFSSVAVSRDMVERYYREEGEKALAPSRQLLVAAGIKHNPHILVGGIAPTIVEYAKRLGCQMIYIGTRGMTAISNLVLGSIAIEVLHLADVPVVLVR